MKLKGVCLLLGIVVVLSGVYFPDVDACSGGDVRAGGEWNILKGFIKDKVSGNPIPGAYAVVQTENSHANISDTNASGYYEIHVADGIYDIFAFSGGHNFTVSSGVTLAGKSTLWMNFSLDPAVARTSVLKGYLTDSLTSAPLSGVRVVAQTPPDTLPGYVNITTTDSIGYYQMHLIPGGYGFFPMWIYTHYPNGTSFTISPGQTLWVNLNIDPILFKGTVKGYITDSQSGGAIPGARVGASHPNGFENYTLSDTSGYYELDMIPGNLEIRVRAFRYMASTQSVLLNHNTVLWLNISLEKLEQDSILRGYVKDSSTGSPLPGVYIELSNQTYKNTTATNASGFYEIYSSAGAFTHIAYRPGYLIYISSVTLYKNQVVWVNISLEKSPPETATVRGWIKDAFTNQPIPGAQVQITNLKNWFNTTNTNASGFYTLGSIAGKIYMTGSATGYHENRTSFSISDGEIRWVNLSLYPQLPRNVTLKGYVSDLNSSLPIENATVRISGYPNEENETKSHPDGYYEMMIVPAKQTLFVSAPGHVPNSTTINPSGSILWLNFSLEGDTTPPILSEMVISPMVNVSYNNSADISGNLTERCIREMDLYLAEYRNGTANRRNYTARLLYSNVDNPDTFPLPTRKVVINPKGGYNYSWKVTWNATTDGALLGNASERIYTTLLRPEWSQDPVIIGGYKNATMPGVLLAIAFYDSFSGALRYIIVDPDGINKQVNATSDPTGMFGAISIIFEYDLTNKKIANTLLQMEKMFSIKDQNIRFVEKVRSGEYLVLETVTDWGENSNLTSQLVSVDNDPPIADAGDNITGFTGRPVKFNGSRSTDNVGITNYTWEFFDDSAKVLYGERVEYTFITPGIHNVTLTVRDGANNSAEDILVVNITIPPGHISGKVTSQGTPLKGASVKAFLSSTGEFVDEVLTDINGAYNFTSLVEGIKYNLTASFSGYITQRKDNIQANATGINFDLEPITHPGYISGKVVSGDSPLPGASVKAYLHGSTNLAEETTTDASGGYNLTHLIAGETYDINVTASGYAPSQKDGITANATGINFNLNPLLTKGWLTGQVYAGDTNAPLSEVKLTVYLNGSEVQTTYTDASGKFNITLNPGTYSIEAKKSGYQTVTKNDIIITPGKETSVTFVLLKESEEKPDLLIPLGVASAVVIAVIVLAILLLFKRRKTEKEETEETDTSEKDKKEDAEPGPDEEEIPPEPHHEDTSTNSNDKKPK